MHHCDKSFNVSTGFRFHVFDLLLEIVYKCVFVVVIGVDAYLVLSIEIIELFFIFFTTPTFVFRTKRKFHNLLLRHPYIARTIQNYGQNMTVITGLYWHFGTEYLVRDKN